MSKIGRRLADADAVAIGAHYSDVTFSGVRLRMLGGKAKVTTQPAGQ